MIHTGEGSLLHTVAVCLDPVSTGCGVEHLN